MMRIFFIMILFFAQIVLFAQKPVIDSITYKEWPSLDGPTISKNGQYVFYNINNVPIGGKTLVVQSTDGKWRKEFKGGLKDGNQALSDKYFLFITKNDSLGMLTLGTNQIRYTPNTSWCNLQETTEGECLLYPSGRDTKILVLKNLKKNRERIFTDVESWSFDEDVLVLIKSLLGKDPVQSINLVDIATGKLSKIWEGIKPENLVLDMKHKQLAFKTGDSVWYYKTGLSGAVCISDKSTSSIEPGLNLGYLESFSNNGKFIFTSLIGKTETIKPQKGAVEVWSYTDVKLQVEQDNAVTDQKYAAVINIEDHRLIRLQQREGEWFQFAKCGDAKDTFALVENPRFGAPWTTAFNFNWDLISLKTGKRKYLNFLNKGNISYDGVKLSPCGKYVIYFDRQEQGYFSYEIATERIRNLTKGINISWADMNGDDRPGALSGSGSRGLAVWLKGDKSVLVYDQHDIWKLDPLNMEKPINLTNGYGKKNGIVFNLTFTEATIKDSRVYLTAFSKENKNNGFFQKKLDKGGDPELLHMGPYIYQTNSAYVPSGSDFNPIKATMSERHIVRRMSATDAPNYFSTKDFKTYTRLTDLQPQKKYSWYTTELHNWKSLDGRKLQGILYKPENFDPNKKYPVIFHYYERKSDGLNAFITPESLCHGCNIDISTYVSNGYLIFTPDIYYKVGDPMQGTYDAVVSAANYVSTLPFVNAKKMGIQGCSFGGVQTNYLITHTNLFAAAVSSSGISDWISHYGGIVSGNGASLSDAYYEGGQFRMGASLWEKPDAFIKNSPIFQVDKITTPLLIMQGKKDPVALFSNTLEFYLGLRRMGKKAWMLAYPEGGHGLGGNDADDFSIRMMQFFDHYLKDKPAPVWMTRGISAPKRETDKGYEYDTEIKTPGSGLVNPPEQQKLDFMMTRKPITITLK